ncbi:MAG: hypothetical protein RIQ56_415 [Candidatus Parcubacteria bacterium]|jgi:hypothetical protein
MALEHFDREAERLAPTPSVDPEKTLKAIMGNEKESVLFGKFLAGMGRADLNQNLLSGNLNQTDMDDLNQAREEFFVRKEQVQEVSGGLTEEMVENLVKSNRELEALSRILPTKDIHAMVQRQLEGVAMSDPTVFRDVQMRLQRLQRFEQGAYKDLDRDLEQMCAAAGISSDRYAAILQDRDPARMRSRLAAEVRQNFDAWTSVRDWWYKGGISSSWARSLAGRKGEIDTARADLRINRSILGTALNDALTTNPQMLQMLSSEILGDKQKKDERESGFRDLRGKMPTMEGILAEWQKMKPAGFNAMNATDQDREREAFLTDYASKAEAALNRGTGFWKGLALALVGSWFAPTGRSRAALKTSLT